MHVYSNPRFFGRPQAPADPTEVRRIERWLATARVFLAVSALAAIYMDPTQLGHAPIAYGLLGLYLIHGVLVITLLRRRQESTPAFRLLVHTADVVWPAFISIFAEGPRSPFFLFFFFVLAVDRLSDFELSPRMSATEVLSNILAAASRTSRNTL